MELMMLNKSPSAPGLPSGNWTKAGLIVYRLFTSKYIFLHYGYIYSIIFCPLFPSLFVAIISEEYSSEANVSSVRINLKELGGGSDVEMFEILPRDWHLKPIFTQK